MVDLFQFLTPIAQGAVLAAIIAGLFKLLSDKISDRKAEQRIKLEYRLQSIQTMRTRVDRNIDSFYLPMMDNAFSCATHIQYWFNSSNEDELLYVFYWYQKYVRSRVQAEISGSLNWFLKTRIGELLSRELDARVYNAVPYTLTQLHQIHASFEPELNIYQFSNKIHDDQHAKKLLLIFTNWAKSNKEALEKLRREAEYLAAVILSEWNSLTNSWYQDKYAALPGHSLQDIRKYLSSGPKSGSSLNDYLKAGNYQIIED